MVDGQCWALAIVLVVKLQRDLAATKRPNTKDTKTTKKARKSTK